MNRVSAQILLAALTLGCSSELEHAKIPTVPSNQTLILSSPSGDFIEAFARKPSGIFVNRPLTDDFDVALFDLSLDELDLVEGENTSLPADVPCRWRPLPPPAASYRVTSDRHIESRSELVEAFAQFRVPTGTCPCQGIARATKNELDVRLRDLIGLDDTTLFAAGPSEAVTLTTDPIVLTREPFEIDEVIDHLYRTRSGDLIVVTAEGQIRRRRKDQQAFEPAALFDFPGGVARFEVSSDPSIPEEFYVLTREQIGERLVPARLFRLDFETLTAEPLITAEEAINNSLVWVTQWLAPSRVIARGRWWRHAIDIHNGLIRSRTDTQDFVLRRGYNDPELGVLMREGHSPALRVVGYDLETETLSETVTIPDGVYAIERADFGFWAISESGLLQKYVIRNGAARDIVTCPAGSLGDGDLAIASVVTVEGGLVIMAIEEDPQVKSIFYVVEFD